METISLNTVRVYKGDRTAKYWRDVECEPQTVELKSWSVGEPLFVLSGKIVDSHDEKEIGQQKDVSCQTYSFWLNPLIEEGIYTVNKLTANTLKHEKRKWLSESQDQHLNMTDITELLSASELEMVDRGKKHWSLDVFNKIRGGYVSSKTLKWLIGKVIESTWLQAKVFYGKGGVGADNRKELIISVLKMAKGIKIPDTDEGVEMFVDKYTN